jgi:probable addiction module antidote protein
MTTNEFDLSNYLDSKEMIAEYLSQVLEDGDMDELLSALGYIAKAKGMSQVSKDTGLGRESLYKTLAKGSKPKFETVIKVLNSLGIKLQVVA